MNDDTSLLASWAAIAPGAARAAGLAVPVAALAAMADGQSHVHGSGVVAARLAALHGALRPLDVLRELYEWVRALAYTGTPEGPETRELADALGGIARGVQAGALVDQLACRDFLIAIEALATAAGYDALRQAAEDARLGDGLAHGDWESLRARADELGGVLVPDVYQRLLRDAYAMPGSLYSMRARIVQCLDQEAHELRKRCAVVGQHVGDGAEAPEAVMSALDRVRAPYDDALSVASRMVARALPALERHHGALTDDERGLVPAATPPAAEALGTEGEAFAANVLGVSPVVRCFVTAGRCGSVYSLANVVFHELLHAWHMHRAATASDLAPLDRIVTPWAGLLLEGLATRRERELFDLFVAAPPTEPIRALFDDVGVSRDQALAEFDVDTRYWWVIRLVRALFELDVQAGQQSYGDFVREAAARTGLSEERIHRSCFPFFERPGSALTYAVGRLLIDDLYHEAIGRGLTSAEFGSRVLSMGMRAPDEWQDALFGAEARRG